MTTGEQGDTNSQSTGKEAPGQRSTGQANGGQGNGEPPIGEQASDKEGLSDLLATLPWLLKQYVADSLNLLETEGQIAVRSLILIVALVLSLAGLIAGSWLVLIVLAVYGALEAGVPAWGVVIGIILLHILAFAGLAWQMKTLARYLAFPNSRRALGTLIDRRPPPDHPENKRVHTTAQKRHRPRPGPG